MDDFDDDDKSSGSFTHRRVNAADAGAPQTTGVSSVFAAAGSVAPPQDSRESTPAERSARGEIVERALEFFGAQGPATEAQLRVAIERSHAQARQTLKRLIEKRQIRALPGTKPQQYVLADDRKGLAPALAWKAPRMPAKPVAEAPAPVAAVATEIETVPLICGLLSSGELLIETESDRLRLTRSQARALVDYLDMVSAALKAA